MASEEIAAEQTQETRNKKEPWTRAHKLQIVGMSIALALALIGWYRSAHQSPYTPVYQRQVEIKYRAEQISKELYGLAKEFDVGDSTKRMEYNNYMGNKFGYRIDELVKDLGNAGLHTSLLEQAYFGGMIKDGNQLRSYAQAITNLSEKLPNASR